MLRARKHRASRRNQHTRVPENWHAISQSVAVDIVYTTPEVGEIVNRVWISIAG